MFTDVLMIERDAREVSVEKPYFIVMEAKRSLVLDLDESKAQLLAQLESLAIQW